MTDVLRNPADPLHNAAEAEKELFRRFGELANGFPTEAVLRAAINLILNAVRQSQPKREGAQRAFNELFERSRTVLLDQHYDNAGNRRNVFPFDQHIEMPLLNNRQKF